MIMNTRTKASKYAIISRDSFDLDFDNIIKCQNLQSRKKDKLLFVAPSCLDDRIAGLFTQDQIDANEYVMSYTGKIKSEANDFQFLSSKINEFC